MRNQSVRLLVAGSLLALTTLAQAQHYPAGVEGLKAASLPPPGVYLRDYNYFYYSDTLNNPGLPDGSKIFAYGQIPRVIWISDFKILGGFYGADALLPLLYKDLDVAGGGGDSKFGVGDLFVEPITLSWHPAKFDIGIGYGFWAPVGEYDVNQPLSPGLGFWGHMLTAGATWYPDKEKTWSVSALNRYEINHENPDTGLTPGQTWTIEGGISKTFRKTIEVGVIGYYQTQTTTTGGSSDDSKPAVGGVGPEINLFCPKLGLFTSLRYAYEFGAYHRAEGHTINLTITKRF